MTFRIGIRIPPAQASGVVLDTFRRTESLGLDFAVVPDSPLNYREAWTTMAAAAGATSRLGLGISVTNPVSRHNTVTASAARTLHELSDGRFFLGVGTGDSAVGYDTLTPARVADMERCVGDISALLDGQGVDYDGFTAALHGADSPPETDGTGGRPPVLVAASGPRMLALGGRVGDGVIVFGGGLRKKLEIIRNAAADAGRPAPSVYTYGMMAITDHIESYARTMKPIILRHCQLEGTGVFEAAGIEVTIPDHTAGADGDVGHAFDMEAASRQLDQYISDEAAVYFVRRHTNVGTVAEVASTFERFAELGCAGTICADPELSALPHRLLDSLELSLSELRP